MIMCNFMVSLRVGFHGYQSSIGDLYNVDLHVHYKEYSLFIIIHFFHFFGADWERQQSLSLDLTGHDIHTAL